MTVSEIDSLVDSLIVAFIHSLGGASMVRWLIRRLLDSSIY